MKKEFWIEKWHRNEIGFHQNDVHPDLKKYWDEFTEKKLKKTVFVPLCGKSLDLLFLAEKGFHVIGVEISSLAVEQFFAENKIACEKKDYSRYTLYKSEYIDIYCGDIFEVDFSEIQVSYIYDRAALIALPRQMRIKYAELIKTNFPTAKIFLCTLEFGCLDIGPPFSLSQQQVNELYSSVYQIEQKEMRSILDSSLWVHKDSVQFNKHHLFFLTPKDVR